MAPLLLGTLFHTVFYSSLDEIGLLPVLWNFPACIFLRLTVPVDENYSACSVKPVLMYWLHSLAAATVTIQQRTYNHRELNSSRRSHWCHFCNLRTRKVNLQFTQAHQIWTIEGCKNIAWFVVSRFHLRHPDGRPGIWRKQHKNMDPFSLWSTVQAATSGVMVWGMFSWDTLALIFIASFKHPQPTWVLLLSMSIPIRGPSSDGYFQWDNEPCHKVQIISNWFLEHNNEFTVLQRSPQSPDLNLIEHLWDVVEWQIRIIDVQPTEL